MELKNKIMPINIKSIDGYIFIPVYSTRGRYYINIEGNKLYSNIYKKILTTQVKEGYYYNNIQKEKHNQGKIFYHRAIAEMMLLKKDDRNCINHKNSKRNDNRIKNIEWVYSYENTHHSLGVKNYKSKKENSRLFTKDEVIDIYTSRLTREELKEKYPSLTNTTHYDIRHDRTYKDITENLVKGKSYTQINNDKIKQIPDSFYYYKWLYNYVNKNQSLGVIAMETGISTFTIKKTIYKNGFTIKKYRKIWKFKNGDKKVLTPYIY